jgi:hypothetical protein
MPDERAVALSWRKSSASATENCVEVAFSDTSILVRDSKQESSHILKFTSPEWLAFLAGIQEGRFDLEIMEAGEASR